MLHVAVGHMYYVGAWWYRLIRLALAVDEHAVGGVGKESVKKRDGYSHLRELWDSALTVPPPTWRVRQTAQWPESRRNSRRPAETLGSHVHQR